MEKINAIKSAAMFLQHIYTDEKGFGADALAAIAEAEKAWDVRTLCNALDGVIIFCNELKGNLNTDKRITKNGNENERTRKELIEFLDNNLLSSDERHGRWIAWLEKQKSTWKPTKEQIDAFTHFVQSVCVSGYASPYDNNTKQLYSLLNDLRELKKNR